MPSKKLTDKQLATMQRIDALHKRWVEKMRVEVLTLPQGEERDKLVEWLKRAEKNVK